MVWVEMAISSRVGHFAAKIYYWSSNSNYRITETLNPLAIIHRCYRIVLTELTLTKCLLTELMWNLKHATCNVTHFSSQPCLKMRKLLAECWWMLIFLHSHTLIFALQCNLKRLRGPNTLEYIKIKILILIDFILADAAAKTYAEHL